MKDYLKKLCKAIKLHFKSDYYTKYRIIKLSKTIFVIDGFLKYRQEWDRWSPYNGGYNVWEPYTFYTSDEAEAFIKKKKDQERYNRQNLCEKGVVVGEVYEKD